MKKLRLMALIGMLAIVTGVSAQLNLGIKGGVNMSNLVYDDEIDDKNPKIGFNVGLALDYEFLPSSAIQTGLFFTTKGFRQWMLHMDTEYTENLMYLQLPLHYAFKVDVTREHASFFMPAPMQPMEWVEAEKRKWEI